ncbi:MAG: RNA polymerase-associated protein, partial [Gammaproteobacteria bacterium]
MALLANRRSVMSLYSDVNDPASHAVRFVLAEKAINVEIQHVTADDRPEDLVDLNPYA